MGWPGPVTYRQQRAYSVWLEEEWNRPSRTDHYLMAVACEVRRVLSKDPAKHQLGQLRITFKRQAAQRNVSDEEALQRSKGAVFAALGIKQ